MMQWTQAGASNLLLGYETLVVQRLVKHCEEAQRDDGISLLGENSYSARTDKCFLHVHARRSPPMCLRPALACPQSCPVLTQMEILRVFIQLVPSLSELFTPAVSAP